MFAKCFDVFVGTLTAMFIAIKCRFSAVHCRSYVAALTGWILKRILGVRFLFDMRGFWADERVDGGLWLFGGFLYRLAKRLKHCFLADADEIITLTERVRLLVEQWPEIGAPAVTVVPTCVDLEHFSGPARDGSANSVPVVIYTGSLGTWYLLGEMLSFVKEAINRFPRARFLLLTRNLQEADRELGACRRIHAGSKK